MNNELQRRREQLLSDLPLNGMVVLIAGKGVKRSADADFPFTVNHNFAYLTNINEPDAILMMIKLAHRTSVTLFIRDIDLTLQKWNGKYISIEKAKEVSQIDSVMYVSAFESSFMSQLTRAGVNRLFLDLERLNMTDRPLAGELFAKKIKETHPALMIENIYPAIAKMRTVKSDAEVKKIEDSISITKNAFERMLKHAKTLTSEFELQAEFEYELKRKGASPAFDMIVAGGVRATVLHYVENDESLAEDQLVLCDMGASKNFYNSDITRTFPKSGKFSDRQKLLYNIVLEAMDAVFERIKPGVMLKELNDAVLSVYEKRLKDIGLINDRKEISNYYYHGVSHFLGMDVHDVGQTENMVLVAGNVITVEPGLYIEAESIGIRIEDDVLVTEEGYLNLSECIVKTTDEIEGLMSNG
ncbi:MAG: Xaa-Pro dipeptidase [Firmicutes bacterium HGW-Firmicutes-20]|nr:MAG: Xaa-Pro dipeptidase [Firmicutes bacterium HGW-Firmicutes-20]PKM68977.1 MAG: Xaa-Pro dipeptidase [Firmicutes bacterium HGW-Firmicutes-19]